LSGVGILRMGIAHSQAFSADEFYSLAENGQ
jgi:hypothetical protein